MAAEPEPPFPPLERRPEAELRMHLDFAIALRQLISPNFYFVQIGAYDGRSDDPLYAWLKVCPWRGLLVEPQPRFFARLRETYREHEGLELRQVAVGPKAERKVLYTVDEGPEVPSWVGQLASFERDVLLSHREFFPDLERHLREEPVDCVELNKLLSEAQTDQIDLLQIDVEGYDHELIRHLDFDRFGPAIVHFEHVHLSPADHEASVEKLIEHGYRIAIEDRDTLAYHPATEEVVHAEAAADGPTRLQANIRELERRLEESIKWGDQVGREAAAFLEQCLSEQRQGFQIEIEAARARADEAEKQLAELKARLCP